MKPETLSFYEAAVERALQCVVTRLDDALDLEWLARQAALSPFHFHRIFRGMLGETPLEIHRRLRMERAAFQLSAGDSPVTRIALDAGYDSHEAFTRSFRFFYGCSPSEFRESCSSEGSRCERPRQIQIAARSRIHFEPNATPLPSLAFIKGVFAMNVEIKVMPELRVFAVPHVGPYSRISEAFARLGEIAARAGWFTTKPTMLALYYDDPEVTPEAELRADAGLVVPETSALAAGVNERRVPGGRYACAVHVGPYEQLGDAWAELMGQWLPRSGERLGQSTPFEIYVNNPMEVPSAELRTELYVPLAETR